jgi:hypothetical protein
VARRRACGAGFLLVAAWLVSALVTPRPVNPPVVSSSTIEARLDVPADVRAILRTSCADCHSDETRWPWYARVFPASWLLARDVAEGRGQLNLSRWSDYSRFEQADLLDEMCIRTGARTMPLPQYRWLHPDARLSDRQIDRVCAWTHGEVEQLMKGME